MRDVYAATATPAQRAEEAHARLSRGDASHADAAWLLGACVAAVAGARRARLAPEQLSFACAAPRFRAAAAAEGEAARGEARAAVRAAARDSAARARADADAFADADAPLARVRRFVAACAAHAAAVAQLSFLSLGVEPTAVARRAAVDALAPETTRGLCAPCAARVRADVRDALAGGAGGDDARAVCAAALDALDGRAAANPAEWLLRHGGGGGSDAAQLPRVTLAIMDAAACAREAAEAAEAEAAGDAALPPPMWPLPTLLYPLSPAAASRCAVLVSFLTLCAALRAAPSLLPHPSSTAAAAPAPPPPQQLVFHFPLHDARALALLQSYARVVAAAEEEGEEVRVAANVWVQRQQLSEQDMRWLASVASALGFERLIAMCIAMAGAKAQRQLAAMMGGGRF
jgi:hypothetical protein